MKTLPFILLIVILLLTVWIVYEKGKYLELTSYTTELVEKYADTLVENVACNNKDIVIKSLTSHIDCLETGKECSMEKYNALNSVWTLKNS